MCKWSRLAVKMHNKNYINNRNIAKLVCREVHDCMFIAVIYVFNAELIFY